MASIDRDKLSEYLSAYLDDELPEGEREALERLVAKDEEARRQLDELRQTASLVSDLPRAAAPASLVDDLTAIVERRELLGDPEEPVLPRRPWWYSAPSWLSAAAVVMITAGGGWYVFDNMREPAGPVIPDSTSAASAGRSAGASQNEIEPPPGPALDAAKEAETAKERSMFAGGDARFSRKLAVPTEPDVADAESAEAKDVYAPDAPAKAKPAPALKRSARMNDDRSLERKLDSGLPAGEIVAPAFANESNRLVVMADGPEDQALAMRQIAEFGVANRLPAVAGIDPKERGQVLLNIPRDKLRELVEAVSTNPTGRRSMRLGIGSAVASDPSEIEKLVYGVQSPTDGLPVHQADEGERPAGGLAADDKAAAASGVGAQGKNDRYESRLAFTPGGGVGAEDRQYVYSKKTEVGRARRATSAPADHDGGPGRDQERLAFSAFLDDVAKAGGLDVPGSDERATPLLFAEYKHGFHRPPQDEFITLVVQVLQAQADAPAATQPVAED